MIPHGFAKTISCSAKAYLKSEFRALKTNLGGAGSFKILRVTHLSLPGCRWEVGIHLKLGTNTNEIPKTQQSRRVIRNWDLTHFDSLFGRQSGRDWNQCFLIWKSNHHHHHHHYQQYFKSSHPKEYFPNHHSDDIITDAALELVPSCSLGRKWDN